MSDQIRATGYRTVPVAEEVINPEHLRTLSTTWHYGWQWSGPEKLHWQGRKKTYVCRCSRAACGLVIRVNQDCFFHQGAKLGAAKQLHRALECPA